MASIIFGGTGGSGGTEILNTTYIPRFAKHESAPERELSLLNLAREDGSILVAEKYGTKRIMLRGYLTAATESALETAIDSFKELFSRKEKELDISWEAGTRRYVATCVRHEFDRDHFNILFVPWTAEFIIVKGIGEDINYEEMYNGTISNDVGGGVAVAAKGSAEPKPHRIQLTFGSTTGKGKRGIAFTCPWTSDRIGNKKLIYTQSAVFVDGDILLINTRDKTVKFKPAAGDIAEVAFHGEFPEFALGNNTFATRFAEIEIEGSILQGRTGQYIYAGAWESQSFMIPWKDESIMGVSVRLIKHNNPTADLIIRIETDDGGKPSGTLAHANAEITTVAGSVPVTSPWKFYFTLPVTLEANRRYWLVVKAPAEAGSGNCFRWVDAPTNYYIKGNSATSVDSGANWTDEPDSDFNFIIYVGGKRTSNSSLSTLIFHYPRYL